MTPGRKRILDKLAGKSGVPAENGVVVSSGCRIEGFMEQSSDSPHETSGDEEFLARLALAFPSALPEGLEFGGCECDECVEVRRDFMGREWTAIPDSVVKKHYDHLPLLGDAARRYYIPAFLRAALSLPESSIGEWLYMDLSPSGIKTSEIAKFTKEQRAMILEYLQRLFTFEEEEEEWRKEMPPSKRWLKMLARWAP